MPTMPGENGGGLSRKHILASIDALLQRLGLDYVDLYEIHRWDPRTPSAETMEALHDVVRSGKARYIGSSMFAWRFAKAQSVAPTPLSPCRITTTLVCFSPEDALGAEQLSPRGEEMQRLEELYEPHAIAGHA